MLIKYKNETESSYKACKRDRRWRYKERKALRFLKTAKRVLVLEAAATLVLSLSRGEVPSTDGGRKEGKVGR